MENMRAGWYTFSPKNDNTTTSIFGMEDWSSTAAGKSGRITRKGSKYSYASKEIKLWGLNDCYAACAPDKVTADRRAALYRKCGINAVRLHKYADGPGWAGIQSTRSFTKFDATALGKMDYFVSALKAAGIFVKLSPTFGVAFGQDDLARVPYHAEIGTIGTANDARVRAGNGWIAICTELQDLQIEQTTAILKHSNPHTGMTYAADPSIFCVEMYNEDSVLFYTTQSCLQKSPTIRARIAKQFTQWLKTKYSTEAAWKAAWGASTIMTNPANVTDGNLRNLAGIGGNLQGTLTAETFAAEGVVPWGNPWFYDAAMRNESGQGYLKSRLLDSMLFLMSLQNTFYSRFEKAIRATGYKGEILASNWQAGETNAHFLNLESDARLDLIDRHNYCGGGMSGTTGTFNATSSLSSPGMAVLSSGFQQVENLPFSMSEWIHVFPNEWYGEGPAIIAAYGMGLQGWDISFMFQNNDAGTYSTTIGRDQWDTTNPAILATFPTISRMVRRLDISEAPTTVSLNVSPANLQNGTSGFKFSTTQNGDEKSFTSDKIPTAALAATRIAVKFTTADTPTPALDMTPYLEGMTVVSATRQLRWTPGTTIRDGCFTINTKATKGFVGFAPGGKSYDLGSGWSITPARGFAIILFTAKGKDETLANAREIIVTATARARNSGMVFNSTEDSLTTKGAAPVQMESVAATVTFPFDGTLRSLDHDGITATTTYPFVKTIALDTATDKTPFFVVLNNAWQELKLTLDPAGGTVEPSHIELSAGKKYGDLPTPIRENFSFTGWWTADGKRITATTVVKAGGEQTLTAGWQISPIVTPSTDPAAMGLAIGVTNEIPLSFSLLNLSSKASVSLTGLPKGMKFKYDKATGTVTLTGTPTGISKTPGQITITIKDGFVTETFSYAFPVQILPPAAIGKFAGYLHNAGDREHPRGTFSITTNATGKVTAQVLLGANKFSFTKKNWDWITGTIYYVEIPVVKKGVETACIVIALDLSADWAAVGVSGQMTAPVLPKAAILRGQRNILADAKSKDPILKANSATALAILTPFFAGKSQKVFTILLDPPKEILATKITDKALLLGKNYLHITLKKNGAVTWSGSAIIEGGNPIAVSGTSSSLFLLAPSNQPTVYLPISGFSQKAPLPTNIFLLLIEPPAAP